MDCWELLVWWLAAVNAAAFFAALIDKRRARLGKWRIRERSLFILAALGGSPGLYLSLLIFRHKTRRARFMAGVPLIFLCQAALAYYFIFLR